MDGFEFTGSIFRESSNKIIAGRKDRGKKGDGNMPSLSVSEKPG
jgi:hypothetical protein